MHEMSILTNEVDTVLVYAAENNASWVIEVSLVGGGSARCSGRAHGGLLSIPLAGDYRRRNRLIMAKVPLKLQCEDCLLVFGTDIWG